MRYKFSHTYINHWFLENGLLLNPSKTEVVRVFGTASRLRSADTTKSVNVAGAISLQFSNSLKLYRALSLTMALSMDRHVSSVVSSCNFHICALRRSHPSTSHTRCCQICCSEHIVGARLDYCNSLLYGTYHSNLDRLQRVQKKIYTCTALLTKMSQNAAVSRTKQISLEQPFTGRRTTHIAVSVDRSRRVRTSHSPVS